MGTWPQGRIYSWLLLGVGLALAGCTTASEPVGSGSSTLVVGILPGEDPAILRERYLPLSEYLSNKLGMSCELTIPSSYDHLLELFHDGEIDLAYFGGFTFVRAQERDNAIPLVMRAADTRFTSYFLVNATNPARALSDLRGKTFAFGPALSTSGHIMPRFFLSEQKIAPERFFGQVRYSGAHDVTAYWVRDGEADVGAANSRIIDAMFFDSRLSATDVRVIWETPPYPNYVWAIHPGMNDELTIRLRDAFLNLTPTEESHAHILKLLGAESFVPASSRDFSLLREIVDEQQSREATR